MNTSARNLLEKIMIFSTVTSFMLSILIIFDKCVVSETERPYLFSWFTYASVVFSGLVFMLNLQIMVNEKTKIGAHIRFIILYLIFILVISFFLGTMDVPYLIIPALIFLYFFESSINDLFIFHDSFTYEYQGKKGKELIEFLFHNNFSALEFAKKMNSTRSFLFVMGFIQFVVLLIPNLVKLNIPILAYVFAFIFYFSLFIIFIMIGLFNKESYYAFLGFDEIVENPRGLYKVVCLIFTAALFFSVAIASNHALINIPKIDDQIVELRENYIPPERSFDVTPPTFDMDVDFDIIPGESKPDKLAGILKTVYKILKIAGIICIAVGGLILFIRPFFSDAWKAFIREKRLYHFFKKVLQDFKELIITLFSGKKDRQIYSTVSAKNFSDSMKDFLKGTGKSREKKAELDRLTKVFMNIINWGSKRDVIYKKSLAPAEYTTLLEQYFLFNSDAVDADKYSAICKKLGEIYEKALYDKDLLTKDEEKQFTDSADLLFSYGNKK